MDRLDNEAGTVRWEIGAVTNRTDTGGGQPLLTLKAAGPFNYGETLAYMSRSDNECLFRIEGGSVYKLLAACGEERLMRISALADSGLEISVMGEAEPSADWTAEAERYVKEWFDLNTDLSGFYAMAEGDALLREPVSRFRGLRLVGVPDLFEALLWAIIGQQINLPFAYTLKRRLVETFGCSHTWNGERYWLFPTPERIAGLETGQLTALQLTGKKSEYVIGVAAAIAEGRLDKRQLLNAGDRTATEKRLVAFRGIGPWTANYVMMRCLRLPTALPLEDVGLHNAIKHVASMDRKPTLDEVRRAASGWTGWEAYATFYFWRMLY